MRVSAITLSSQQTFSNTKINNSRRADSKQAPASKALKNPSKMDSQKNNKIYDSINEWKYFCHQQIEQGKLNIIA